MYLNRRNKFLIRMSAWVMTFILYCLIVYSTTLIFEILPEQGQTAVIHLLVFIPSIYIIAIYGEMKRVFDRKAEFKKMTKHVKAYFILVVLWLITFVSLFIRFIRS